MRGRSVPRLRRLAAVLVVLSTAGCAMTVHQQKVRPGAHAESDVIASRDQLRLRLRGLVDPMCGEVEAAADEILATSVEPEVQRSARAWKLAAVPALRKSLFQPDPLTAVSDTWVLLFQMADDLETGGGRSALGAAGARALAACRRMEGDFSRVVASFTRSGDVSHLQALAREWAARHPVRRSIADREPVPADAFGRELATSLSVGEAAEEMTAMLDDLGRKLEVYSVQMPRQSRWEAERFASDLAATFPSTRLFALSERAVSAAEQAAHAGERLAPAIETVTAQAPNILSAERVAAIEALHRELQAGLAFLQEERIASLEKLSTERMASMKDLRDIVATEREATTRDVEQVTLRVVDYAIARLERLVAVVLAVLTLAALVLLLAARWLLLRPAQARHA